MKRVWVAGEALIDLVPVGDTQIPIVGGGPANTAKALAMLDIPTSFIGGISSDEFGASISAELSSVDLSLALRSNLPTALAIVTLDKSGSASYQFKLAATATFDFRSEWLPASAPDVLHIGTLATVVEPGASELFDWASSLTTTVVFDPNIRPSVISDRNSYRSAVERWVRISKIVKLSREDLEWLGYGPSSFLELGVQLVVVTHGAEGITAHTQKGEVSIPAIKVEVVDTVGAGDTVGAILVEGVVKYGVEGLLENQLIATLTRAARAAGITCTRAGAKPPTLSEIEA